MPSHVRWCVVGTDCMREWSENHITLATVFRGVERLQYNTV
jgi:hypothetical protein